MNTKELEQIIENHRHWLDEGADGREAMRANLRYADLSDANLRYTDLRYADLSGADLSGTDLSGADLKGVDLSDANLRYADLRDANLSIANLRGTNLRYADLRATNLRNADLCDANLRGADLRGADLKGADLSDANLRNADLRDANLSIANLRGTNLRYADLSDAKNVPYIPMICPEEGSFIGYKKASGKIVKLLIPEDAKRSSATTRKCRCDKATVLTIYELDGSVSKVTQVSSDMDSNFIYKINKEVIVDDFDSDRWNECSTGIHFFMQRHEAVGYIG